ncbi:nucleotidyltransferase family protein [Streptomyces microflavus]|uniref:nucleotidyltransferase family protein n=1 Tax=Streptomyces microflavus TaxID=1919 RepID=UPI0037FC0E1B
MARVRVAVYVTRPGTESTDVLTFAHRDFPEAGIQVPAGGVEPGENLEAAAIRECAEETGITAIRDLTALGVDQSPHPETGQERVTVFFHAHLGQPAPDHWQHTVGGTGTDDGMVFDCRFQPVEEAESDLVDRQGELLGAVRSLGRAGPAAPEAVPAVTAATFRGEEGGAGGRADTVDLLLTLVDTSPDLERAAGLVRRGVDWDRLLALATRHRVLPLVARNLDAGALFVPSAYAYATMDTYLAAYLYHRRRNEALLDELAVLARELDRADVPFAVRKGLVLATRYHRDLGVRPMMDLDLLVDAADTARTVGALTDLGYSAGKVDDRSRVVHPLPRDEQLYWHLHTNAMPPMFRATGDPAVRLYTVDITRELALPSSGMRIPAADVVGRARPLPLGTVEVLAPSPEDLVLDLCVHTYKESTTLRYLHRLKHQRLIQYADLREVLRVEKNVLDWETLVKRAAGYGAVPALYFTLAHLESLWAGSVPPGLLPRLGAGLEPTFLDQYGAVDLPEPAVWDTGFLTRMFDDRVELPLPKGPSLV